MRVERALSSGHGTHVPFVHWRVIPAIIGQSADVVHVGMQIIPIGESAHVQPFEPGGQAFVQSAGVVQL